MVQLLEHNLQTYGEYVHLIYEGQSFTNIHHDRVSSQWAHALLNLGVSRGDHVLLMLPNIPEVFWAYSAVVKTGAVVIPVMPLLQVDEVRHIVQDAHPVAVLTSVLLADKVSQAVAASGDMAQVLLVDDEEPAGLPGLSSRCSTERPELFVEDDAVAVILYTSGTTGRPKGVELTHRNLYSNARAAATLAEKYKLNAPQRTGLFVLPLSHAFGFTMMNTSIVLGERNVLLPHFQPQRVLEAIQTYRVTHFSGVPTMFRSMLAYPDADRYDVSSLTLCISGSAPMHASEITAFQDKFGATIYQGYGLSEAAPIVTAPHFDKPHKPESVGLPLPGVEVRIVDETDTPVPTGKVGELVVRGPNVSPGYHRLPEATRQVFKDGWLHTGDMAKVDDEGYVYIVDRKRDVIIRGGFNIYPRDVEFLLNQHDGVSESAVIGVPAEPMGEEVVAFVVKTRHPDVTAEELLAYCRAHLAKYKTPREIRFVSYLPKNLLGKVDKKQLRQQISVTSI
ncbi:class I adenylate-forming enzyme family protein [Alicyclobacillus contaminans]|uniref:class I adenylate-forming enzyme family protein n=1 Tax=Alicyclobacillus contaminans TaxID=392016 RepID=UPI001FDF902A|nr:AMP-binding protein [Alicyclobacillus contaminans]